MTDVGLMMGFFPVLFDISLHLSQFTTRWSDFGLRVKDKSLKVIYYLDFFVTTIIIYNYYYLKMYKLL